MISVSVVARDLEVAVPVGVSSATRLAWTAWGGVAGRPAAKVELILIAVALRVALRNVS